MGVWFDRAIITAIVTMGLFIMYRALKEPIDLLFGMIGKGFSSIRNSLADKDLTGGYDTISYG